jgi:putative salt-induced outer membrane protein YdiY
MAGTMVRPERVSAPAWPSLSAGIASFSGKTNKEGLRARKKVDWQQRIQTSFASKGE